MNMMTKLVSFFGAVAVVLLCNSGIVSAWMPSRISSLLPSRQLTPSTRTKTNTVVFASGSGLTDLPDENDNDGTPKLGIDIGSMLEPLSEKEADELKAAATEAVNDAIAAGLDDITEMRATLKREVEANLKKSAARSEAAAEVAGNQLLTKIDALTDEFLSQTSISRQSTKRAAAADRASSGKSVELGSWGKLGGASVVAGEGTESSSASSTSAENSNRIIVLGDVDGDPYAKQLLPLVTDGLKSLLNNELEVTTSKPTAVVPLGGDGAAAILLFCTSFSEASSVEAALDRCLRQTVSPGSAIAKPPSQIVAVTTVGTERTNKMPYSMQNMMGGKLDKRRQIEEAVMRTIQNKGGDYTICKFGELKGSTKDEFTCRPGDNADGTVTAETASTILVQAMALQPTARNATLSCTGSLPDDDDSFDLLEDAFLRLDGPEIWRLDEGLNQFDVMVEYVTEWAFMLAESGKGLTTPVRAEVVNPKTLPSKVKESASVQLVFLPTATGNKYMSKEEERKRDQDNRNGGATGSTLQRQTAKDGGLEFVMERTDEDKIRVRVKRCNYVENAIVKEISEETILRNFRKSMEVWKKDHP